MTVKSHYPRSPPWAQSMSRPTHGGADVFSLDRKGSKAVRSYLGPASFRGIENRLDVYVVLGDGGAVVTAAHRLNRLKNA